VLDLRLYEAEHRRTNLEIEKLKQKQIGLLRHDYLVNFRKSKEKECA